jgi:hypothetical protein
MRSTVPSFVVVIGVLALACGPETEAGSGSSAGSSAGTTEGGTTGSATADEASSGEPPSVCEPPPEEGLAAYATFDDDDDPPLDAPDGNPYTYDCQIAEASEDAGQLTLAFVCDDGEHSLVIDAMPAVLFDTTGDFQLSVMYTKLVYGFRDFLLTLRRADGELVLVVGQSPLPPEDATVPVGFFDPFAVSVLTDVCSVEPFDEEDCGAKQRQALRFEHDDDMVEIHDGRQGELASYVIVVDEAYLLHDISCGDAPERYYSWLISPASG